MSADTVIFAGVFDGEKVAGDTFSDGWADHVDVVQRFEHRFDAYDSGGAFVGAGMVDLQGAGVFYFLDLERFVDVGERVEVRVGEMWVPWESTR